MTSSPYLNIWATGEDTSYPIVKTASLKRDFLSETHKSHGYHCQPLSTANLHGWDFIAPHDIEVTWDGVSNTEAHHVKVLKGERLTNGTPVVDTGTANATIAFNLNCYLETDPDHYLLLSGPANTFIPGAKPMTALIRSDWYTYSSLQFCWKLTTPNKIVTFKAGEPFLRVINYPKNLLESTEVSISTATLEMRNRANLYAQQRAKYYAEHPGKWPFMYKKAIESLEEGSLSHLDATFKPAPKDPHYGN
jgi:hypothetical protein